MKWIQVLLLAVAGLCGLGIAAVGEPQDSAPATPIPTGPAQEIEGGRVSGLPLTPLTKSASRSRYKGLLKKIEVPEDREAFGDFYDFGYWSGGEYAGHKDLPAGYWVYLAPHWYAFREQLGSGTSSAARAWGPEQATGAPDTWPQSGDITTAWAARLASGQREWLELSYRTPGRPVAVLIYETFHPGAVDRVTAYDSEGKEVELWSGADPTSPAKEKGISIIPIEPQFDISRIRIYLDSTKVPGWNEIDAVGLLDASGKTQWAASATASSTYADLASQPSAPVFEDNLPKIPR